MPDGTVNVEDIFKKAEEGRAEEVAARGKQTACRESLRNLAGTGLLNAEQKRRMNEMFPVRTRKKDKAGNAGGKN